MNVERIDHISIGIPENSVEKALKFYRDALGFEAFKLEEFREGERTSFFFKMGENALLNLRTKEEFRVPEQENFDHFCIVVDGKVEKVKESLSEEGYEVLRESRPLGSEGRRPAVYVEDPFGYKIEIKEG